MRWLVALLLSASPALATPYEITRVIDGDTVEIAVDSAFTKDAVANAKEIDVQILKWDKYGGRALADVFLDHQSLAQSLISAGLARPYKGEAKQSWCE